MSQTENNDWLNDLSEDQRRQFIDELVGLIEDCAANNNYQPLLDCVDRWQKETAAAALEEIWRETDTLPEDQAMSLAVEAQHSTRQAD